MKKIPYGISNFAIIREQGYAYADKTIFIKNLENTQPFITYFRPRRFGKSLFVSTLQYYYDYMYADKFDSLFADTYIGSHPTPLRSSFAVLVLDFSGISTDSEEQVLSSFIDHLKNEINHFLALHGVGADEFADFSGMPADILDRFFVFIERQLSRNLYLLIDEYDHFANELLSYRTNEFAAAVSTNGFLRKFFEVVKTWTRHGLIHRIFITGVSPITLDGLTSGFSIASGKTLDPIFHEMLGFTKQEALFLIEETLDADEQERDAVYTEIESLYDSYRFYHSASQNLLNSDMVLYYLSHYAEHGTAPEELVDSNASSDYGRIAQLFNVRFPGVSHDSAESSLSERYETLESILHGEPLQTVLTRQYNLSRFNIHDFRSLLFYMGFLTIASGDRTSVSLVTPNYVIKRLYFNFFDELLHGEKTGMDTVDVLSAFEQIAKEGRCDKFVAVLESTLHLASNRVFRKFDERYVQILAFDKAISYVAYHPKVEYEVPGGYIDFALLPFMSVQVPYYAIFELKYIKAELLTDKAVQNKRNEALIQLNRYAQSKELLDLEQRGLLKKWILIFSKDKCVYQESV